MAGSFLRRSILHQFVANPVVPPTCRFFSQVFGRTYKRDEDKSPSTYDKTINAETGFTGRLEQSFIMNLSPLHPYGRDSLEGLEIKVVDPDLWQVSSGIPDSWKETVGMSGKSPYLKETVEGAEDYSSSSEHDPDFDEIEDMRLHGNLFFKLDRNSREFEEYSIDFHRRKSSKKNKEKLKQATVGKEGNKKEKKNISTVSSTSETVKNKGNAPRLKEGSNSWAEAGSGGIGTPSVENKRIRTPTFNQLTDPYHLPFCLDLYISKSSVRACIVHRVTSKVVAVAHSISKDMKHDLASTKDSTACAAVGGVLARRAIADDIHNVVYTPRKGEKLEGKLQIVLQSIIDNGIDVKLKIKQKRHVKMQNSSVK